MKRNISAVTRASSLITTIGQKCSWHEKNPNILALPMVRFPHSFHCKSLQKDFGKFALKSPIRDCCLPKAAFLCVEISAKMAQQDSRSWLGNGILLYPLYRNVCHLSLRSPRALQLLPGKCPFPQEPTDVWLSYEPLEISLHVCWQRLVAYSGLTTTLYKELCMMPGSSRWHQKAPHRTDAHPGLPPAGAGQREGWGHIISGWVENASCELSREHEQWHQARSSKGQRLGRRGYAEEKQERGWGRTGRVRSWDIF